VWSTSTTVGVTPTGTAQTQTIYGLVPAGQNVPSTSSYSDAVTITVSF
jgi:spore coat protein U-like protein